MPFQDYRQFMDLFDHSTSKDKAKMAKFYIHNMAITYMNVWDPNARLGDLQLMAIASWMNHEELRVVEIRRLMIKEKNEPLMIRAECYKHFLGTSTPIINVHKLRAPKSLKVLLHFLKEQGQLITSSPRSSPLKTTHKWSKLDHTESSMQRVRCISPS